MGAAGCSIISATIKVLIHSEICVIIDTFPVKMRERERETGWVGG